MSSTANQPERKPLLTGNVPPKHNPKLRDGNTVALDTETDAETAASRVFLTTHKVVIDANDEEHARDLYERLWNDGYRVHRETHRLVKVPDGVGMSLEVERVSGT